MCKCSGEKRPPTETETDLVGPSHLKETSRALVPALRRQAPNLLSDSGRPGVSVVAEGRGRRNSPVRDAYEHIAPHRPLRRRCHRPRVGIRNSLLSKKRGSLEPWSWRIAIVVGDRNSRNCGEARRLSQGTSRATRGAILASFCERSCRRTAVNLEAYPRCVRGGPRGLARRVRLVPEDLSVNLML